MFISSTDALEIRNQLHVAYTSLGFHRMFISSADTTDVLLKIPNASQVSFPVNVLEDWFSAFYDDVGTLRFSH